MATTPVQPSTDEGALALFLVRELRRAERMVAQVRNLPRMQAEYYGKAEAYRLTLAYIAGQHGYRTADALIHDLEAGDAPAAAEPEYPKCPVLDLLGKGRCILSDGHADYHRTEDGTSFGIGYTPDEAAEWEAQAETVEPVGGWEPRS